MNTIDKLLQLKPTDLEEVRAALNEAITELRREAEEKLASLQSDPKAAGSVKEAMLTIEIIGRAARDVAKLEAAATKTMQHVWKRLRKQQPESEQAAK